MKILMHFDDILMLPKDHNAPFSSPCYMLPCSSSLILQPRMHENVHSFLQRLLALNNYLLTCMDCELFGGKFQVVL